MTINNNIQLSGIEAENYNKYKEKIYILINSGVLDLLTGKVELNIHNQQIQNIQVKEIIYKRIAG